MKKNRFTLIVLFLFSGAFLLLIM